MDRNQAHLAGSELPLPLLVVPPAGDAAYLRPRAVTLRNDLPAEFGEVPAEGERVLLPLLEYEWTAGYIELPQRAGAVLDEFIRLEDGAEAEFPERVLSYAQRWGALHICKHGLPSRHRSPACSALGSLASVWAEERPRWEPVEAWRRHIRHLKAVLGIVRHLRIGRSAPGRDWREVAALWPPDCYPIDRRPSDVLDDAIARLTSGSTADIDESRWDTIRPERWRPLVGSEIEAQRAAVAYTLGLWFQLGKVEVHPAWFGDDTVSSPSVDLRYEGLPGLLAVQLAATARSPRGLYQCAGCHHVFTPPEGNRRPAAGRRAWCPDCGRLAQWREYQRSRYERQKAEREASDGEAR